MERTVRSYTSIKTSPWLLFRNFLALWLRRGGLSRSGSGDFRLHQSHLLLVFLEEHRAARFTSVLLSSNTGAHLFGKIQGGAHLTLTGGCGLAELLHRLAHLAAHHALQFGNGTLHHPGEIFERAPNRHLGLYRFEIALEPLNLAQALGDNRRVLLIQLLEVIRLALVLIEVLFQSGQLLRVMGAIGFVIGGRCRLQ